MAAPRIPNLLDTLRASKASRGRGNLRNPHAESSSKEVDPDTVVQQTDDDAAGSRLSAVQAGYLEDEFAHAFTVSPGAARRMPIINRGTYVRTRAIDALVDRFLDAFPAQQVKQIVSLGAGTDTRFFRLASKRPELVAGIRYHELDFAVTTTRKIRTIQRSARMLKLLEDFSASTDTDTHIDVSADGATLLSPSYSIHAVDIRLFASSDPPRIPNIDPTLPTLVISECCLTYLSAETGASILSSFAHEILDSSTPLCTILYEPLRPDDPFGRTMAQNLGTRGIDMPSLRTLPSLEAQMARLREVGLDRGQVGREVRQLWEGWVSREEKSRLRGVEMVDEEEEWLLLAGHYGIVWGWRGMQFGDEFEIG